MNWTAYGVILRLETPLHIGWRRVGNLWQTRPYILPHQLLAALAVRCAEWGEGGDEGGSSVPYVRKLEWLKKRVKFTYFFPALEKDLESCYLPFYDEKDRLKWRRSEGEPSELTAEEFDYLFLDAEMRTGIDYSWDAAREGQLFAFECVRPRCREWPGENKGKEVYFGGYVFIAEEFLPKERSGGMTKEFLARLLDRLQVGGERKYGWGLVKVLEEDVRGPHEHEIRLYGCEGITAMLDSEVRVTVKKTDVGIPAHVLLHGAEDKIDGQVEVVLTRSTRSEGRLVSYGKEILGKPCYQPGSKCKAENTEFLIDAGGGIWGVWKVKS
ncbi:MAG: hypothetical protein ACPLTR_04390 [Thermacetogeniaceae bacterium]